MAFDQMGSNRYGIKDLGGKTKETKKSSPVQNLALGLTLTGLAALTGVTKLVEHLNDDTQPKVDAQNALVEMNQNGGHELQNIFNSFGISDIRLEPATKVQAARAEFSIRKTVDPHLLGSEKGQVSYNIFVAKFNADEHPVAQLQELAGQDITHTYAFANVPNSQGGNDLVIVQVPKQTPPSTSENKIATPLPQSVGPQIQTPAGMSEADKVPPGAIIETD